MLLPLLAAGGERGCYPRPATRRRRAGLLAGREYERRGRSQEISPALDVGEASACELALGGQQIEDGRQPRRLIRLEGGRIGLFRGGPESEGELSLPERGLHVGVRLPYLPDDTQLKRRHLGLGRPAQ